MKLSFLTLGVCLVAGCTLHQPPLPDVAPPPDDLASWTVPDMIPEQPPATSPIRQEPSPKESKPTAAEKVYDYKAGDTYAVAVSVGFPLDIALARGEQVHNVTDGDRTALAEGEVRRWEVRQGLEGLGKEQRHHIFVTVTQPGLRNGLIVTTTHRTLYITLESVAKSSTRVLRWREEAPLPTVPDGPPVPVGPLPDLHRSYHVGYTLHGTQEHVSFFPRQVVDDGKRTYVILPERSLFDHVPLVRLIGSNGPTVVNTRQYKSVLIIDALFARAELRYGTGETAEIVTIERGNLRTIGCPTDVECPRWPDEAYSASPTNFLSLRSTP